MGAKELIKAIGDDSVFLASERRASAEITGWYDTGSYTLNALLSGSIWKGMPDNKIICLAGESGVGKTFLGLGVAKSFLDSDPNATFVDYETEAATTTDMLLQRNIDIERFVIVEKNTVEEFKFHAVKLLKTYHDLPEDERFPMMVMLDSLGQLSTTKEVEDATTGKDVSDMTRARAVKSAFRVLDGYFAKVKVPLIITNHTYTVTGSYIPMKKMGGGTGIEYAPDCTIFLTKSKDRDEEKEVVGNILHATTNKSRISIENKTVDLMINYNSGLNRYYGLLDIALKGGVYKKLAKQIELPDGTKVFEKAINKNPEKYFTKDILDRIEEVVQAEFRYG